MLQGTFRRTLAEALPRQSQQLLHRHTTGSPLGPLTTARHATHGAQGRANGPKNGPGKRLGAKKTGDQYVIPGNIIFRQRGALWHPGDNVGMGRDHTIYALEHGYVKYYRDPLKHPGRKYIGIVFDKGDSLPAPLHAARKRRLNMHAVPRRDAELDLDALPSELESISLTDNVAQTSTLSEKTIEREDRRRQKAGMVPLHELEMRSNYSFRETNYQIGRAAERAGIEIPKYKPNDRFAAWRKRGVRRALAAEKRSLTRKKPSARKARKA